MPENSMAMLLLVRWTFHLPLVGKSLMELEVTGENEYAWTVAGQSLSLMEPLDSICYPTAPWSLELQLHTSLSPATLPLDSWTLTRS